MKVYLSHLIYDDEMKQLLDTYEGIGIESIEFSMSLSLDYLKESIQKYRERMGAYIVDHPFSVHGPFLDLQPMSWDSLAAEVAWKRYEQAYEAATELNAERIVYHTCFMPIAIEEGWAERMIDFWLRFLEGKDTGMQVHMENVFDPHYRSMLKVAQQVTPVYPNFSLCLDIGHAHAYAKESVQEWMESLEGHLGHFHIHDNMGDDDSHLALGEGNIDCPWVMQKFKERYMDGCCTIENTKFRSYEVSLKYLQKYGILI